MKQPKGDLELDTLGLDDYEEVVLSVADGSQKDLEGYVALDGRGASPAERERARKTEMFLRSLLQKVSDPALTAQMLYDIAGLLGRTLEAPAEALVACREAFQRQPKAIHIARGYRKAVLRAGGEPHELAAALEGEARATRRPERQAPLELARGRLLETELDNAEAARGAYERALRADAAYIPAMSALERLARSRGAHEAAANHARQIAETVTDPRLRGEHYARAARHLERAKKPIEAMALAANARVGALSTPAVSFILERLHSSEDQVQELISLRESQLDKQVVNAASAWFDVGALARYRLGSQAKALEAFEKALELWNGDKGSRLAILRELTPLLRAAGNWKRLTEVELDLARAEPSPRVKAAAYHRCGVVFEHRLDDMKQALECFEQALAEDSGYHPAMECAGRIYQSQGAEKRLIEMHLLEAKDRTVAADKAAALRRAGELFIENPERLTEGVKVLRRAVELAPDDLASLSALERALIRSEEWQELADIYEHQLEQTSNAMRRGHLLRQLADVASRRLGDRKRAISALREMATLNIAPPPEHLVTLAEMLEEEGDLDELVTVLEELASRYDDPALAATQLQRIAEAQERRGDMAAAVDAYRRAVEVAPPTHGVIVPAARAFLRNENHDELAKLFLQAASEGLAPERARWLHKAAEVFDNHLGQQARAVDLLRQARDAAPDHVPTLHALEELLSDEQSWSELLELLEPAADDGATALRQGTLAEATGDLWKATDHYAAAVDAGATIAALPLLRVLAIRGDWDALLLRYREQTPNAFEQPHALYRAAEIAAEQLDDAETARQLLGELLELDRSNATAMVTLIELQIAVGEERRALLRTLLETRDDAYVERACLSEILLTLGDDPWCDEALEEQLALLDDGFLDPLVSLDVELNLEARSERKKLVEVLRKVVADPQLEPELRSDRQSHLGRLLEELGALQQAADALEAALGETPQGRGNQSLASRIALSRLYGALGDHDRYSESLAELTRLLPAGPERATALRVLAFHQQDKVDGGDRAAIASLETALKDNACDYSALKQLDELLLERNDRLRLIHHLMRAFSTEQEPARVVALGTLLATRLIQADRLEPALEVLDRTMAVAPSDLEALKLLAEAHRKMGAWAAAVQRLRQIAAHDDASTTLKRQAFWYLAAILVHRLDDGDGAREVAAQLAALPAPDAATLALVVSVQELVEDFPAAAKTLEQLCKKEENDEKSRSRYLFRLGKIQEEHLDDQVAAMETFGGVAAEKYQLAALKRVLRLAEKTSRWDLAAKTLERVFEQEHQLERKVELRLRRRLVGLLDGELNRPNDAIPHYERIAELEPSDSDTMARLAKLSYSGDGQNAIEHHRNLLELQPNRIQSYRALRQLLLRQKNEDALFCVEAVLDGLGHANEEETYFYAQRRSKLEAEPQGTLSADDWLVICPELASAPLAVLRAIHPVLHKVFPVDVASYGISKLERNGSAALVGAAKDVAALFDIPGCDVALAPTRLGPTVLGGDPITLLIPPLIADALPREQLFVCGALLGRTTIGGALGDPLQLHHTTDQQLQYLIWATCELVVTSYSAPMERNAIFEDIKGRLEKALSDVPAAELNAAAQRCADENTEIDGAELRGGINRAAARAGTLAAIDPSLAIYCLRQWHTMFAVAKSEAEEHGLSDEAWAGPVFAVSAAFQEMRRRLGMGVSP